MPNFKEIRSRITSVGSTMQITSAMKMVSAANLKELKMQLLKCDHIQTNLQSFCKNISSSLDGSENNQYSDSKRG